MQSVSSPSLRIDYLTIAKPYASVLDINKIFTLPLRNQLRKSVGYYSENDLETLKSPPEVAKKTKAAILLNKLCECEPGKLHWKKYQGVCQEILEYCLVPPLPEPMVQSGTRDSLYVRDIIFSIPYDLNGFWTFITTNFGSGLIFECKNYNGYAQQNDLIISSKYVGKRKFTKLGMIVTRNGLDDNAKAIQEKLWNQEEKMLLCLNDKDLEKILKHSRSWSLTLEVIMKKWQLRDIVNIAIFILP